MDFWDEVSTEQSSSNGVHLLIDGDIIAFQCSAVSDGRVYTVLGESFKYKKEAKDHCDSIHGGDYSLIVQDFIPEPESHALHNVKLSIEDITQRYPGATTEVFLTGPLNFRMEINSQYKANRIGGRTPFHLNACKQYLTNYYGAKRTDGLEADDLIGIRATELGDKCIIISTDKDLDQLQGKHYNWTKQEEYEVSPSDALFNFYSQCLTGDTTDNIQGIKGIGPVKARKILDSLGDSPSEEDVYCKVVLEYESKGMTKEDLKNSAQLLYILREPFKLWKEPCDIQKISEI